MIRKTKKRLLLIFFIVFLSLFAMNPSVYAHPGGDSCEGGTKEGVYAHYQPSIHQNQKAFATDLHFIAWQAEQTVYINGWRVTIEAPVYWFEEVDGVRNPPNPLHEILVTAHEPNTWDDIPKCYSVDVHVEFWLKPKWNTVRMRGINWTSPYGDYKALPNHGWVVSDAPLQKIVTIYNDEPTGGDIFKIANFEHYITTIYYFDLETVPYIGTISENFTLNPGDSKSFPLSTQLERGHVYFHFSMLNATDHIISEPYGDHEIAPPPVGGIWVPVDKFGLLAPYIGLASTIVIATAATAIYIKRVKRRKKKQ